MDEHMNGQLFRDPNPGYILTNGRKPIPEMDDETIPFKGTECGICGFVFVDLVDQNVVEAHYVRCVDKKAEEIRYMKRFGYTKTPQGEYKMNSGLLIPRPI